MDKKKNAIRYTVGLAINIVVASIVFIILGHFDPGATATGNMVIESSTFIGNRQCMYSVCDRQETKLKNIFRFSHVCGLYAPGDKIIMTKIMPDAEPINIKKGKKK